MHGAALISRDAKRQAERIIQRSINKGATCELDDRGATVEGFEGGNFRGIRGRELPWPGRDEPRPRRPGRRDIFATVLAILSVISISNENTYGNGTAFFTTSDTAARKIHHTIKEVQVGVNESRL